MSNSLKGRIVDLEKKVGLKHYRFRLGEFSQDEQKILSEVAKVILKAREEGRIRHIGDQILVSGSDEEHEMLEEAVKIMEGR